MTDTVHNIDRQRLIDAMEDLKNCELAQLEHGHLQTPKDRLEADNYYRHASRLRAATEAAQKAVIEAAKKAFSEIHYAFFFADKYKQLQEETWGTE